MLHAFLYRTDKDGRHEFRSRSFTGLDDLARYFASEGLGLWDRAEILGTTPDGIRRNYSAEALLALVRA